MNCFEKMIQDCFSIPQFIDYFYPITEIYTPTSSLSSSSSSSLDAVLCIQYHTDTDAIFTEFGTDEGIDFVLTCKCADFTPHKNQKIMFHNKVYKIVSWMQDGFNLSWNLNVKSVTSK